MNKAQYYQISYCWNECKGSINGCSYYAPLKSSDNICSWYQTLLSDKEKLDTGEGVPTFGILEQILEKDQNR